MSHELYGILRSWGEAQSVPAATLVTSFLEQNKPIFKAMAAAIEAQKRGREEEAVRLLHEMTGGALVGLGEAMKAKKKR